MDLDGDVFDLATVSLDSRSRAARAASPQERRYLIVFDGETSRVVSVPELGELVVGRDAEADVRIEDPAASRVHAKIVATERDCALVDLGSRNGTTLNGQRVSGSQPLRRGDVLIIGAIAMVVHRDGGDAQGVLRESPMVDFSELRRRAQQELTRRTSEPSVVTLVCLLLSSAAHASAVADAFAPLLGARDALAKTQDHGLVALLLDEVAAYDPVLDFDPSHDDAAGVARGFVTAALALDGSARAGVAQTPTDAADADTLVAVARAAATSALPGKLLSARALPRTRQVGKNAVVVAEPAMIRVYDLLARLAPSVLPVLVTGETGSGKENAASALHDGSPRASGPFVTLNCAALPDGLVESELFGHERGAFSGAVAAKAGLFESADGGTLFLDEVGELSLPTQAKLLRAVETKIVTRVGGTREVHVDIRFVTATHRDLSAEVRAGRFREDLLFRLGAATVFLPPLRDRKSEIPILARMFLKLACDDLKRPLLELSTHALHTLNTYRWPGNVRELRNAMTFVAATSIGPFIVPEDLPAQIHGIPLDRPSLRELNQVAHTHALEPRSSALGSAPGGAAAKVTAGLFRPLVDEIRELERTRILEALEAAAGVQTRAAELIGMPVRTLFAKLRMHGIDSKRPPQNNPTVSPPIHPLRRRFDSSK